MAKTIAKTIALGMLLAALVYFLSGCATSQSQDTMGRDLRKLAEATGIWSDRFEHSWYYENYPYGDSSHVYNSHYNKTHHDYSRQHYRNDLRRVRSWLKRKSSSK